jgi:glycosyltransferase involved in cell wall biosynthesis
MRLPSDLMSAREVPVSVLILARNEEENLPQCLAALTWCTDIVVVDDVSTDRTAEVAQGGGARVLKRKFDSFAGQRNWALETAGWKHEWILHLDADEVVTPELAAEVAETIPGSRFDAYRVPSRLIFMGRALTHAAMYPTYQVRLGRNPGLRFKQVGHGQREDMDPSRVGTIREPYLHYSFSKGLEEWLLRHNRYSTAEAQEEVYPTESLRPWVLFSKDPVERRRALKRAARRMPLRPTLRFLWLYVLRRGFLDGHAGFEYCRLMACYEAMIQAKVAHLRWARR